MESALSVNIKNDCIGKRLMIEINWDSYPAFPMQNWNGISTWFQRNESIR